MAMMEKYQTQRTRNDTLFDRNDFSRTWEHFNLLPVDPQGEVGPGALLPHRPTLTVPCRISDPSAPSVDPGDAAGLMGGC